MSIKRALISVSDKSGIVPFAKFLASKKIEILSTGGTSKLLKENGIENIEISDYTGFQEMLDGRVKTLHPKIHGGLLHLRNNPEHVKTVRDNGIEPIDLVVVNLYPFAQTLEKEGVTQEELIENIDIGGPSMLRSAAKNFSSVTVITNPQDYAKVKNEIEEKGDTTIETRKYLMGKTFARTAEYDSLIAKTFNEDFFGVTGKQMYPLRYGENPHQAARFYKPDVKFDGASITDAKQLQGKTLSYNNILDADVTMQGVLDFDTNPACVIVKHLSPCGIAIGDNIEQAYEKALESDSLSAFGGVVAVNREVSEDLANELTKIFLAIVIAPKFSEKAKEIFTKKERVRLLEVKNFKLPENAKSIRSVLGGLLTQELDTSQITEKDLKIVTKKQPTEQELKDMMFAFKCCKHVKSNAIVVAKNGATVGIGGGLTSRVDSCNIAIKKAGEKATGAVAASDAFFPFSDGPESLAKGGVTAIIQPGGSLRDNEVIKKCDELGISMVFTGIRRFRH